MLISIICPFYNERAVLATSVAQMVVTLRSLPDDWELLLVNDGSTDSSPTIARELARHEPSLKVIGYHPNRGRGAALRFGFAEAKGDLFITTEIDSSWGPDIVPRILAILKSDADADLVVASPHLPGGGYRGVPIWRVMLSAVGNWVIRASLGGAPTMSTGMARGYRREVIQAIPLMKNGKDVHLEIVSKAIALGYRIREIPATLAWGAGSPRPGPRRKSSTSILGTIRSHLEFSLVAAPFRYIFAVSGSLSVLGVLFLTLAFYRLLTQQVAIFFALTAFFLFLFGFLIFAVGVLANQNSLVRQELWRVQSALLDNQKNKSG